MGESVRTDKGIIGTHAHAQPLGAAWHYARGWRPDYWNDHGLCMPMPCNAMRDQAMMRMVAATIAARRATDGGCQTGMGKLVHEVVPVTKQAGGPWSCISRIRHFSCHALCIAAMAMRARGPQVTKNRAFMTVCAGSYWRGRRKRRLSAKSSLLSGAPPAYAQMSPSRASRIMTCLSLMKRLVTREKLVLMQSQSHSASLIWRG